MHDASDPRLLGLRLLQGLTFHLTPFKQEIFSDWDGSCAGCGKETAGRRWPGVDHEGYVTPSRIDYEGLPPSDQWNWVCNDCFTKFRDELGFVVASGLPPAIPEGARDAFRRAWRARQKALQGQEYDAEFNLRLDSPKGRSAGRRGRWSL